MSDTPAPQLPAPRPLPVTAVCLVGWVVSAMQLATALSPEGRRYALSQGVPAWAPTFLAAAAMLGAASLWGLWTMRRAGVLAFILVTGTVNIAMLVAHAWGAQFMLFPVLATLIGLGFLPRMR